MHQDIDRIRRRIEADPDSLDKGSIEHYLNLLARHNLIPPDISYKTWPYNWDMIFWNLVRSDNYVSQQKAVEACTTQKLKCSVPFLEDLAVSSTYFGVAFAAARALGRTFKQESSILPLAKRMIKESKQNPGFHDRQLSDRCFRSLQAIGLEKLPNHINEDMEKSFIKAAVSVVKLAICQFGGTWEIKIPETDEPFLNKLRDAWEIEVAQFEQRRMSLFR